VKKTLMKNILSWLTLGIAGAVGAGENLKSQLDVHKDLTIDNNPKAYRILFVGDSITLHGVGDWTLKMGWDHEAGMAASSAEKDYVHLLATLIQRKLSDRKVEVYYHNYGGSGATADRLKAIDQVRPVKPHLVVIQLGEHEKSVADCRSNYRNLLRAFTRFQPTPKIIAVGVWNPNGIGRRTSYDPNGSGALNNMMKAECAALNIPFASVEKYALDPKCAGWGTHPGVQWHPNDNGHRGYADELFNAFLALDKPIKKAVITVDAAQETGKVPREIFGHNVEAADPRGIHEPVTAPLPLRGIKFGQGYWNGDANAVFPVVIEKMKQLKIGQLRYPGGCLAHNFNWKQAVGPHRGNSNWKFGIDEFIQTCRAMNAEPMITMTEYALPPAELPRHNAELVEYLNAPATPEHPWAMKRKEWGHSEPYGVKWFELGNESDHGNHDCIPGRRYTPEEYAQYAVDTATAMRAIDPSIKIGVLAVPGTEYDCSWNRVVFKKAGPIADFIIVHFYGPGFDDTADQNRNVQIAMSYGDRLEYYINQFHRQIKLDAGKDLPLAVTEYNVSNWDRGRTYLGGWTNADVLRIFMKPGHRIIAADFWQLLNDLWGIMSSDYTNKIVRESAGMPFLETMVAFTGTTVVETKVKTHHCDAEGIGGWGPAHGTRKLPAQTVVALPLGRYIWTEFNAIGLCPVVNRNQFTIDFKDFSRQAYPNFLVIHRPQNFPANEPMLVKLSFKARFASAPGNTGKATIGLGLCDLRGWNAVRSAIAIPGLEKASQWTDFSGYFSTRADCPGMTTVFRFENVDGKLNGKLELQNLRLDVCKPEVFPAYPAVSAIATKSDDGKKLFLIAFNRDPANAVQTKIELSGISATSGRCVELYQENTAMAEYFPPQESVVTVTGGTLTRQLPPHSMTAFEFDRQ